MSVKSVRREFAKATIDQAIRKALNACGRRPRRMFAELLWEVQNRSELLKPGRYVGSADSEKFAPILNGLLALLEHRDGWLRPVDFREPSGSTPLRLFSSLAHHLLTNFPVPPVLLSAWFRGTDWQARRSQRWFCHVGVGQSLRTAGLPIELTKRMAHEFSMAPAHYPIEFALRWAQVRGLGGSDDLARAVASTRLGNEFGNDDFWISVIHLFRNTPRLDLALVGPIVDYLHDRKFEPERAIIGDETEIHLAAPEPDLSIKGRTVASLMRRVEEWRAHRRPEPAQRRLFRWDRSGFGEFWSEADDGSAWTIRELLDSDQLAAEGTAMQHCVATYTDDCLKRRSTIWSLGSETSVERRRLVTIEVDPQTKHVVQASMKCNDVPDEYSMTIVRAWADREGLLMEI